MAKAQVQVVAEKIASTVRVLELLEFQYEVRPPERKREDGNKSPRVVRVLVGKDKQLRVYNSARGHTWANGPDGKPLPVKSVEDLYEYLKRNKHRMLRLKYRPAN
jgi:hypothetical protein